MLRPQQLYQFIGFIRFKLSIVTWFNSWAATRVDREPGLLTDSQLMWLLSDRPSLLLCVPRVKSPYRNLEISR